MAKKEMAVEIDMEHSDDSAPSDYEVEHAADVLTEAAKIKKNAALMKKVQEELDERKGHIESAGEGAVSSMADLKARRAAKLAPPKDDSDES